MDIKKKVLFFFAGKGRWKFALFATVFFAFFFVLAGKNSANAYYDSGIKVLDFEESVFGNKEFNQESYTFSSLENIFQSLSTTINGCSTEKCREKLGFGASGGAIGNTVGLISVLYTTPPASSVYYLADLSSRLNLVQPAYAQGIGYSGLRPLLPLWKASRDIAYTVIIFVFLLIGFGIMLRIKISPQAVITIQQAIPKVLITLVLISFSYAIAGLMIDLMYLTTGIGVSLVENSGTGERGLVETLTSFLEKYNLSGGTENLNTLEFSALFLEKGGKAISGLTTMLNPVAYFTSFLPETLEKFVDNLGKFLNPATRGLTIILSFILGVILLFAFFKLFLSLLLNYIQIIIQILIAPFILMINVIPGQNTFGKWLRGLAQNLLPFPSVAIMLILSSKIISLDDMGKLWMPPLIHPPFAKTQKFLPAILSFGFILLTAKIPDIIKSMFEKKPFPYGTAIGEAMGTPAQGFGLITRGVSMITDIGKAATTRFGTRPSPRQASSPSDNTGENHSTENKPASSEAL